jgi:outer membrane protein assembly factor BamA
VSLRLRAASPAIGSDYELYRGRAGVTQYLRVPFTRHWVLATHLAGGLAQGTIGGRAPFELGGISSTVDVPALVPGSATVPGDTLRGYTSGALGGTGYVLGNLELRFPLAAPLLGHTTWPLFLRRIHGAVFLDAGDAFDRPGEIAIAGHHLSAEELRFGTGAELRLETVFGYWLMTDVRIGVARALGALLGSGRAADRAAGVDLPAAIYYLTAGASF